jgi:type IV pilus assembly protein PilA
MKSMQKGFTLIELMIVVAIIAILAAIAIPQYETYITKTQFSEAGTVASGIETDLNLYWNQNGACPSNGSNGFPAALSYAGKYVKQADIVSPGTASGTGVTATCDIKVTFNATSVSKPLQSATVLFQGAQSGGNFTWKCSSAVADKYKPETCR